MGVFERITERLSGWRLTSFSLLGLYVIVVGGWLLVGGAAPVETSMEVMEDEVLLDSLDGPRPPTTVASASAPDDALDDGASVDASVDAPSDALDDGAPSDALDDGAPVDALEADAPVADPAPTCAEVDHTVVPEQAAMLGEAYQHTFTTLEGEKASLGAYAGCPLVVNFFAKWCAPCVREMPEFDEFWRAFGDHVALVGWAIDGADPARDIIDQTGVTYPAGVAEPGALEAFGGLAMPTTSFIDSMGNIVETHSGVLDLAGLIDKVNDNFGTDFSEADVS